MKKESPRKYKVGEKPLNEAVNIFLENVKDEHPTLQKFREFSFTRYFEKKDGTHVPLHLLSLNELEDADDYLDAKCDNYLNEAIYHMKRFKKALENNHFFSNLAENVRDQKRKLGNTSGNEKTLLELQKTKEEIEKKANKTKRV